MTGERAKLIFAKGAAWVTERELSQLAVSPSLRVEDNSRSGILPKWWQYQDAPLRCRVDHQSKFQFLAHDGTGDYRRSMRGNRSCFTTPDSRRYGRLQEGF